MIVTLIFFFFLHNFYSPLQCQPAIISNELTLKRMPCAFEYVNSIQNFFFLFSSFVVDRFSLSVLCCLCCSIQKWICCIHAFIYSSIHKNRKETMD
uniref:Secreted protein n=1 Tax=Rhizophora mucronata TaxID=61149 RepID=A0A2P2QFY2_RHIMU